MTRSVSKLETQLSLGFAVLFCPQHRGTGTAFPRLVSLQKTRQAGPSGDMQTLGLQKMLEREQRGSELLPEPVKGEASQRETTCVTAVGRLSLDKDSGIRSRLQCPQPPRNSSHNRVLHLQPHNHLQEPVPVPQIKASSSLAGGVLFLSRLGKERGRWHLLGVVVLRSLLSVR